MDPTALFDVRSRETSIRRDAQGRWWNGDDPITHPLLVRAFDAWIERAEDGRYCLKNGVNWAYVTIEGAPIFVRSIVVEPGASIVLRLSDGRTEVLDPTTMREGPDGSLYCQVRGGSLAARFDAHAAFQLAPYVGEDEAGPYLELAGKRIRPPRVEDPIAWPR